MYKLNNIEKNFIECMAINKDSIIDLDIIKKIKNIEVDRWKINYEMSKYCSSYKDLGFETLESFYKSVDKMTVISCMFWKLDLKEHGLAAFHDRGVNYVYNIQRMFTESLPKNKNTTTLPKCEQEFIKCIFPDTISIPKNFDLDVISKNSVYYYSYIERKDIEDEIKYLNINLDYKKLEYKELDEFYKGVDRMTYWYNSSLLVGEDECGLSESLNYYMKFLCDNYLQKFMDCR